MRQTQIAELTNEVFKVLVLSKKLLKTTMLTWAHTMSALCQDFTVEPPRFSASNLRK